MRLGHCFHWMGSFLCLSSLIFFVITVFGTSSDVQLLMSFKNSLPNSGALESWRLDRYPCAGEFTGVSCRDGVTDISLDGVVLSVDFRAVANYLLALPGLEKLSLSNSNITGGIAAARCGGRLAELNLAGNSVRGSVYDVAALAASCSSLRSLNMSGNLIGPSKTPSFEFKLQTLDLSKNIISGNGDVRKILSGDWGLRWLDIAGNMLSGSVLKIANCSNLQHLDLSSNDLAGDLAAGIFGGCVNLAFLNLSSNHFSGELPGDLSSCSSLSSLSMASNNFSGNLPVDVIAAMPRLKTLELAYNDFTGTLRDDTMSELSELELLDLSSNSFFGPIPSKLCSKGVSMLKELYLQNNLFTGAIPPSLSNCSSLASLDLSFNYLNGNIPAEIGLLPELRDLIMWQNFLVGELPPELGRISMLENLILDNNGLSGNLPYELANCTNLNWISLSSNHLNGRIPSWLGRLANLAILKFGNNSFSGAIPNELGNCKSLIWLDLNSNQLNGLIPPALARQSGNIAAGLVTGKRYVYLKSDGSSECHGAGNLLEFAGIRPEKLNRLPSRRTCNFTRVYMGNTQYTFNHNGSMIFLDLSYNQLSGDIPKELGSMYYLMVLNLGHNQLAGNVPPELGGLRYVAVLDLSHNQLEGAIPNSFSRLMLSEIDLSNNKLNGTIPELGSLATFPAYRYENNSGLCGFPLPPCGEHADSDADEQRQKSHRHQASLAGSVAMGLLFSLFCIFGFIIIAFESKKRKMKKKNVLSGGGGGDVYYDSRSHSSTANSASAWKFTSTKEAMSISLAAFEKPLQNLTFADLLEATNGFHNDSLIGSGGFGDVYKAQLQDGSIVAIKKLIHASGQGDREFTAEMETIGKIKHRNLVPLLGYCKVGEERLLVYEYMKYGSLEDVLHDRKKIGIKLNWAARRKIAVGAARGLLFLHHNCIPHIIHRDMKSSNVLLDDNLEARVSDFGMARMMSAVDTHLSVSTLAGTPGYVPPEYYQSFRCTTKGDVYSYGVVLLELLTGKRPTDSPDFGDNNLVEWIKQHTKMTVGDVFDQELLKEDPTVELELLEHLNIACACLEDRPHRRPTMVKVMSMFKAIQTGLTVDSVGSAGLSSIDGSFGVNDLSLNECREDNE